MRVVNIILIALLAGVSFSLNSSGAVIDPNSYRQDYYKMPAQNQIQEKALLQFILNSELPKIALEYPAMVVDSEGNQTVYFKGKALYTISDNIITYYVNGIKDHSNKVLSSGKVYAFRTYQRVSLDTLKVVDEFGQTVGWERLGLNDRVVERRDAYNRAVSRLKYHDRRYWQHDLINNIWRKTEHDRVREEYFGSPSGGLFAYWQEGSFFGKQGLWRIERGWDGEKVVDMFYTLYSSTGSKDYEKYHHDGYLLERKERSPSQGLILEEAFGNELTYRKYGDFGWVEEGRIYHGRYIKEWTAEYQGSRIVSAKRFYEGAYYYDERIYDNNGNIDKVLRKDIYTDEVLSVMEDRIYFGEVANMGVDELRSYFDISPQGAQRLSQWIKEMKSEGKAGASLLGIFNPSQEKLTLYNEDNRPIYVISLLDNTTA